MGEVEQYVVRSAADEIVFAAPGFNGLKQAVNRVVSGYGGVQAGIIERGPLNGDTDDWQGMVIAVASHRPLLGLAERGYVFVTRKMTTAERVAIKDHVSRDDQDRFALASHERAIAAIDAGRFGDEMAPVTVAGPKGQELIVDTDEGPRRDTSIEALARLKPVFELPTGEDRGDATDGTVTAGNAPGITDGAAATVVASERAVEKLGLKPMARLIGYAQAEIAPKWLFLAPVKGVGKLLEQLDMTIADFDLIEINEAFAAQTVADGRELGFDWDKVNVNGGAIALGHPIGASGARIVATLLHELRRRQGRYGLATLCLGGGGSVAAAFERV